MATTILPKRSINETPIATDDDHLELLTNDPSINQFPSNNTFTQNQQQSGQTDNNMMVTNTATNNMPNTMGTNNNMQNYQMPPVQVTHNQSESLKNTGGAMQDGADVLMKNTNSDWVNKKWRPMMGWIYMATCTADFVVFPILWSVLQTLSKGNVTSQWQPITLQGAGLYHIAMGAVLGIAAYGRTKEKIEGASK